MQLVQASTGTVVWSETYDREVKDIFELQEDVAGAVVEALKLRLLPSEHIPAGERTANAQAYEQYLQGLKYGKESRTRRRHAARSSRRSRRPWRWTRNSPAATHRSPWLAAEIGGQTVDSAMYELARRDADRAIALSPGLATALCGARASANVQRLEFRRREGRISIPRWASNPTTRKCRSCRPTTCWPSASLPKLWRYRKRDVERNPLSGSAWSRLAHTYMGVRDYPKARDRLRARQPAQAGKTGTHARPRSSS